MKLGDFIALGFMQDSSKEIQAAKQDYIEARRTLDPRADQYLEKLSKLATQQFKINKLHRQEQMIYGKSPVEQAWKSVGLDEYKPSQEYEVQRSRVIEEQQRQIDVLQAQVQELQASQEQQQTPQQQIESAIKERSERKIRL